MRKDPTTFRERFKRWKETGEYKLPEFVDGKEKINYKRWDNAELTSYSVPFIKDKRVTLTNAGRATGAVLSTNLLDSLADNAVRGGLDPKTMIGISTKETTLGNPTDTKSAFNLSSGIRRLFNGKYPGTEQHINYWGDALNEREDVINYHKGHQTDNPKSGGKSVLQEAAEFFSKHPDSYNPGQPGYAKLVKKISDEVWLSPEIKRWYNAWTTKNKLKNSRWNRVNPLLNESKFNLPRFAMGTEEDKRKSTKGNRFVDMSVEELEALSKAADLYWENKLRELPNRSPETIQQMGIDADKEYRKRNPGGGLPNPKLQHANNLIVSTMKSLLPFTGLDYRNAIKEQRLHYLDKWHDYKKGIEATAKAAELTFSTGTLVGAYANWKKWKDLANVARPTFSQLTKSKIANLLQKAQLPMLASGTVIDGALTYDAILNNDLFNAWWNGLSTVAGVGGIIGAADLFNNARLSYPMIDRIFDTSGIIQSAADVLKFGTDNVTNTQNELRNK